MKINNITPPWIFIIFIKNLAQSDIFNLLRFKKNLNESDL
jgi:hypothetical protein